MNFLEGIEKAFAALFILGILFGGCTLLVVQHCPYTISVGVEEKP